MLDEKTLLERCRELDFSAHGEHFQRNLDVLKSKFEGEIKMKQPKQLKKSVALIAAVAAVLSLTAIAVAAGPVWRHLETRILQGEQYLHYFSVIEYDGHFVTSVEIAQKTGVDDETPVIVEIEGEALLFLDRRWFDDLDEALRVFPIENPLLPSYIPEGFVFENVVIDVCPIDHPDESGARRMHIMYSTDDERLLRVYIAAWPEYWLEWGLPMWSPTQEEIEIGGNPGSIGGGMVSRHIGDVVYLIDAPDLEPEQLIRIAESLQ